MSFDTKHRHDAESVLALITAGPVKFSELAPSRNGNTIVRKSARQSINELESKGLIKTVYIGGFLHHVLADWKESQESRIAQIEEQSKHSYCGCIIWQGYCDPLRGPITRFNSEGPQSVRRILWNNAYKKQLEIREIIRMSCENDLCVNVKHMMKDRKNSVQRGKQKNVIHAMKIAQGMRKSRAKLSMEAAREIRESDESNVVLAERYGVSRANISLVKLGKIYKEYPVGGFFSGLLAANDGKRKAA